MITKSIKELVELSPSCGAATFILVVGGLLAIIYFVRHVGLIHMLLRDNNEHDHKHYKKAFFISSISTTIVTFGMYYLFIEICLWQINHDIIISVISVLYGLVMLIMGLAMWQKYDEKKYPEGLFNVVSTVEKYLKDIDILKSLKKELHNTLNQQIS